MGYTNVTITGVEPPHVHMGGTQENIPITSILNDKLEITLHFDTVEDMEQFFEEGLDQTRGIIREEQMEEKEVR